MELLTFKKEPMKFCKVSATNIKYGQNRAEKNLNEEEFESEKNKGNIKENLRILPEI